MIFMIGNSACALEQFAVRFNVLLVYKVTDDGVHVGKKLPASI